MTQSSSDNWVRKAVTPRLQTLDQTAYQQRYVEFLALSEGITDIQAHMFGSSIALIKACLEVNLAFDRINAPSGSATEKVITKLLNTSHQLLGGSDMAPIGGEDCYAFVNKAWSRLEKERKNIAASITARSLTDPQKVEAKQREKEQTRHLIEEFLELHGLLNPSNLPEEKALYTGQTETYVRELCAIPLAVIGTFKKKILGQSLSAQEVEQVERYHEAYGHMAELSMHVGYAKANPYRHLHYTLDAAVACVADMTELESIDELKKEIKEAHRLFISGLGLAEQMEADFTEIVPEREKFSFTPSALAHLQGQIGGVADLGNRIDATNFTTLDRAIKTIKDSDAKNKAEAVVGILRNLCWSVPSVNAMVALKQSLQKSSIGEEGQVDYTASYGQLKTTVNLLEGVSMSLRNLYVSMEKTTGKNDKKWMPEERIGAEYPCLEAAKGDKACVDFAKSIQFYCVKLHDAIASYVAETPDPNTAPSLKGAVQQIEGNTNNIALALLEVSAVKQDIKLCVDALGRLNALAGPGGAGMSGRLS